MVDPIQRMRIECNRYHVAAMLCAESVLSATDTEPQFVGQSVTHFFAKHPSNLVATVTDSTFTSAELFFSTGVTATVEHSTVITGGISAGNGAQMKVANNTITDCVTGVTVYGPARP